MFDELNDDAKQKAREWFTEGMEYFWSDDAIKSVREFIGAFGLKATNYSFEPFGYCYITCNESDEVFEDLSVSEFKRDNMPTGYYIDCVLWETFYDTFESTGDAKQAFNDALDKATKAIKDDMEYQYSDESVDENIRINDYEFTEAGARI